MPDPTPLPCLRRSLVIALAAACAAPAAWAQLQDTPARIVVGFPAGGSADAVARLLTEKLSAQLGRPVIVDNRPGAGGRIAAAALKSAPSDGSVVMLAPEALTVTNPLVFRKLAYTVSDLAPISMVAEFPYVLAAGSVAGAKTLPDFVKWARQSPERASFGSPAAGSPLHFFGLLVGQVTQLPMVHVPFQGGAPLVTAMAGGHVPAGINTLGDMLEMHRSGKVQVLAVSGRERAPLLPDVPTFAEGGYPGTQVKGWYGLYAPAATSPAAIAQWNTALRKVLAERDVYARLMAIGLQPKPSSPAELRSAQEAGAAVWAPIVKASGFYLD